MVIAATVALTLLETLSGLALAQMPDLSQMSGRSLPSPEMPVGTVSVRVIRGAITNNVTDQEVTLEGAGKPLTGRTDASGRAVFPGLTPGTTWRAETTVSGEHVVSQPFVVPPSGGLRVILVAGVGAGGAGAGDVASTGAGASGATANSAAAGANTPQAAAPGDVILGSQTRFVIELTEESLEVFGLLPLGNTHATPVMPAQPIVFQAPDGAKSLTVLEGSTPQAKVVGDKVVVNGPFAPGETPLQIAYRIPYDGDTVTFAQVLPLTLRQTMVVARKLGNVRLEVPGVRSQREARFEGRTYIVVNADRVDANGPLTVRLRGLPHRIGWPRYVALLLVALITLAGVWIAMQPDRGAQDETDARALRVRRAALFEQLVTLERRLVERTSLDAAASGRAPEVSGLRDRREALIAEIEDLDDALESLTSAARARAARERAGKVAAEASRAAATFTEHAPATLEREPRGASRPAVR